ncbi:Uncharacterised protein g8997 [Pycnogonum litorale]
MIELSAAILLEPRHVSSSNIMQQLFPDDHFLLDDEMELYASSGRSSIDKNALESNGYSEFHTTANDLKRVDSNNQSVNFSFPMSPNLPLMLLQSDLGPMWSNNGNEDARTNASYDCMGNAFHNVAQLESTCEQRKPVVESPGSEMADQSFEGYDPSAVQTSLVPSTNIGSEISTILGDHMNKLVSIVNNHVEENEAIGHFQVQSEVDNSQRISCLEGGERFHSPNTAHGAHNNGHFGQWNNDRPFTQSSGDPNLANIEYSAPHGSVEVAGDQYLQQQSNEQPVNYFNEWSQQCFVQVSGMECQATAKVKKKGYQSRGHPYSVDSNCKPEFMISDEERRRRFRKEKNREAARKCREKKNKENKIVEQEDVHFRYENHRIRTEIEALNEECFKLQQILDNHICNQTLPSFGSNLSRPNSSCK